MRVAVFASGSGSNFEAIAEACRTNMLPGVEIALVVCDKPDAKVLTRAERHQIPTFTFNPKEYASKEEFETVIKNELMKLDVSLVVLAGYMRLIGSVLLEEYGGRMINLHPSLLPSFPGKDAIGQAIRYGVKVTGVTVHYVDEGMDTGPIIAQEPVLVSDTDTVESLGQRIHSVEHQLLVEVIKQLSATTASV
ncbi:phosphoribosylglycinamide formyltransferase [Brevibacillus daliensis]|uniref:phosphoribosylglycinamide formyltransferase n=1 Tax=Brevibacillus daliensis TaxID=2892995 RepID=UPI001E5A0EB3|nr:phosphoribosylglycinamide formyltransferase [Brevibacillus daliensis]